MCIRDSIQDVSNNGYYHNQKFKATAEAHGLHIEKHAKYGWTVTTLAPETEAWIRKTLGEDKINACLLYTSSLFTRAASSPISSFVCTTQIAALSSFSIFSVVSAICSVSYTHLDVYKRQAPPYLRGRGTPRLRIPSRQEKYGGGFPCGCCYIPAGQNPPAAPQGCRPPRFQKFLHLQIHTGLSICRSPFGARQAAPLPLKRKKEPDKQHKSAACQAQYPICLSFKTA